MTDPGHPLVKHLAIAIGLKLLVLALLWQFFVRDQRIAVDSLRVADKLVPAASAPQPETQEAPHDQ